MSFAVIDITEKQCYPTDVLKKDTLSTRKATTFRLDQRKQAALANLSRILRRPMNSLVNEAVEVYLRKRNLEVERDLQATLESLRAYRQRDPHFKRAIDAFIDAEASFKDPFESTLTTDDSPVRAEIHRLLHG